MRASYSAHSFSNSYQGVRSPFLLQRQLINLEEGPRLLSNVIECEPGQVKADMPVEVVYEDNEDYTLPKFRPVKK
jgi:uncharacterized OB-fold protein